MTETNNTNNISDTTIEQLEQKERELKEKTEELEKIKSTITNYEDKKSALEKELERVTKDLEDKREERRKSDVSFQEKFAAEQLNKAKEKFFGEFEYKDPETQKILLAVFEKIKSGSVDADLIFKDLIKAHLLLNPEKYVQLEKKLKQMGTNAEEFLKGQSSAAFAGASSGIKEEETELTLEDREAMKFSGIPEAAYRDLKKRGKV